MRVGISQDSKPIKVVDKVNGVFTCTICDTIILDRYSLQDHWYSSKHKQNMKQVQVIAGIEERLVMNRPTIQEMLDQLHSFHTAMLTVVQEVGMIEAQWLNETYEHHHKECEMLAVGCSQKPPQVSNVFL